MIDKDELQNAVRNLAEKCTRNAQYFDTPASDRYYWQQWAERLNNVANGMVMTELIEE